MKLIITIDTEEDNWNRYSAKDNPVENIRRIPALQKLFDEFNVRPTYLVTYPVATNPKSVAILKRILEDGKCEIGMHCHPWNTPPFDGKEVIHEQDTMLCNLPESLVYKKLSVLHEAIFKNFGIVPVSFRAGRWGFDDKVAQSIYRLGYCIDTSVTPFISWKTSYGPDFSDFGPELFRFGSKGLSQKDNCGALLEVPVSIGFMQANFLFCRLLMKLSENSLTKKLYMKKILHHLRLLNQVWFSPELTDLEMMIGIATRLQKNNYPCLNMCFHSTSLVKGLSFFVKSMDDENNFIKKIKKILLFSQKAGWQSQTLAQFEKTFSF